MSEDVSVLFEPIQVGPMSLKGRVMMPPHFSAIGSLWGGSDEDARRTLAYLGRRFSTGVGYVVATGRIAHHLIPGFEPTGMSADALGFFRLPRWRERAEQLRDVAHAHGVRAGVQLTMIGNHPNQPSRRTSAPVFNNPPHVMTREEIARTIEEFAWSAGEARGVGLDAVELHANHDDVMQQFLSPLTNERGDEYGGSFENRCRFVVETLRAVREAVGPELAIGVRLNMAEHVPEGYDLEEGVAIARHLEATGAVDYVHAVYGSPWGNPSYIQPHFYEPGGWAELAGAYRAALGVPVVYTGLVKDSVLAARIVAAGQADIVGIARGLIADPDMLSKARAGRAREIRPCVGCNECVSRRYTEGLPFGCAVNPHAAREIDEPWSAPTRTVSLLVVGGGPAGMELAALAREQGHVVELWEATDQLGGQLSIAARAPNHERYQAYLDWQRERLDCLEVDVRLGTRATVETALAHGADVVAVATGARARRPTEIQGASVPEVLEARDVLLEQAVAGRRVLVVAMDDGLAPLALADFLSRRGHAVTLLYGTPAPAQGVGRYIVGALLGRLDIQGVRYRLMEQVIRIEPDVVTVRHAYSLVERTVTEFDSVILACGGESDSALYEALSQRRENVHILGDAYAPRKLTFATRQAYALAKLLNATHS